MRLIHYSKKPLLKVESREHSERGVGAYKTSGLWVSIEGEYDWPSWCEDNDFGVEGFAFATEIVLSAKAKIKHLSGAAELDKFSEEFCTKPRLSGIDWGKVREQWQGLIISPYCWERRLDEHTFWYYSWDCASGVIWDASAVKELRPIAVDNLVSQHDSI